MLISLNDWNDYLRFYEIEDEDFKTMMELPRNDRKKFFKNHSKMAMVHCENQVDDYVPIYGDDSDWDEYEEQS